MSPVEPVATTLESIAGGDADVILQAGRELGALTAGPIGDAGRSHYVIPVGYTIATIDNEAHWEYPLRTRGTVVVHDTASLIGYCGEHVSSQTNFYVDQDQLQIVGVLNDHDADTPGWGDHRCVLKLRHTPAWNRWIGVSGKLMTQDAFAELVEAGLEDIVEPDGATILEVAQSIQATSSAKFRSGKRLRDGRVQFSYIEELETKAGDNGSLEIPDLITLSLAPFFGAAAREVKARLRFRVNGGDLALGIVVHNAVEIIQAALRHEAEAVTERTHVDVLWGVPSPVARSSAAG